MLEQSSNPRLKNPSMVHEAKRATSDDGSAKGEQTISIRRSSVPEGRALTERQLYNQRKQT